ncbi:8-amino-7-oxononanoate synthase [Polychytrium aggregatum]|uniref:8-amino-7-oxononanoate synthase n=1 Tax=Polychytrium aggregatum TaxID=110093 RepID=UPI0022FF11B2|nr:8-amino-7-oxononanoate synthase [Polychytrium aggregatum]KAI9202704.1 8-amino-7-oxononanoate synthase [Polychytrium aggregatum]
MAMSPNGSRSMSKLDDALHAVLLKRAESGLLRALIEPPKIDFASNDYLSLARNPSIHARVLRLQQDSFNRSPAPSPPSGGSTGSRLLSGNSATASLLEGHLARFHQAPAALLFNSGYDANLSLFATLPQPGDYIIIDSLIHASVHDGCKISRAKQVLQFAHNSAADLRRQIDAILAHHGRQTSTMPNIVVGVESLYSMDGDTAPLRELVEVCESFTNVHLIVDEAHATGCYGPSGEGVVVQLGLQDRIFARLHTFGKAVGCHGAVVVGSPILKEYLINYARPLIYSTFMSHHNLLAIRCAYDYLEEHASELQSRLHNLIREFRECIQATAIPPHYILPSDSPIQGIIVPGNAECSSVCTQLQGLGFDVRPIRSPTVPKGEERLRICLHLHNDSAQIHQLVRALSQILARTNSPRPVPRSKL